MAKPLIPTIRHFAFDAALPVQVREAFRVGARVFAGVHWTSWGRDAQVWNFRLGRYRGGREFLRTVAADLSVAGSDVDATSFDPVARVASGAPLRATCRAHYEGLTATGSVIEFRLYSAASGALAASGAGQAKAGALAFCDLGFVDEGYYCLWARFLDGDVPGSSTSETNAGEWSALKVQVGPGAWTCADDVSPSPGCPLLSKEGASPEVVVASSDHPSRVTFDLLARSVSASCVLHTTIRRANGQIDVPAGAQIIAGLRASASGPQSAVWVLRADLTARLLAVSTIFSTGICECGKTDHHASDVAQAPDGTLFLLTECSLHRYDPNAARLDGALPGVPFGNGGHPGGQCLRFYEGRAQYSTELLQAAPGDLGVFYYNRIMIRIAGRDYLGAGTVFHGANFGELFRGAWWGVRGTTKDLDDDGASVFLDSVRGGVWSGGGIERPAKTHFWRQLRRRGRHLFIFGFRPGEGGYQIEATGEGDTPICAVADGRRLNEVAFPFFVRRATTCRNQAGEETLLVACSFVDEGNGPARRVVELPPSSGKGGGTKICAFWNAAAREFRMSRQAFVAAGGDPDKVPAFLKWEARAGVNGGGVWKPADAAPATGSYLSRRLDANIVAFALAVGAVLPYNPNFWELLCFTINDDGTTIGPEIDPACPNAACVFDKMPPGTGQRFNRLTVPDGGFNPLTTVNLTDLSLDKRLALEREVYPTFWGRRDSDAPPDDLTTYTELLHFSRPEMTEEPVARFVDVVVLVSPAAQPAPLFGLQRRH